MNPKLEKAKESYILVGVAQNNKGELYIVQSVVNRFRNELVSMDVLYAINAKTEPNLGIEKNRLGANPRGGQHIGSNPSGSTISIAELLEYVNQYFPDVLPEDVLKHFGYDSRPEGKLGESVLYQRRSSPITDMDILEEAAKNIDVLNLNEGEHSALSEFKKKLETVQDARDKISEIRNKENLTQQDENRIAVLESRAARVSKEISAFSF